MKTKHVLFKLGFALVILFILTIGLGITKSKTSSAISLDKTPAVRAIGIKNPAPLVLPALDVKLRKW